MDLAFLLIRIVLGLYIAAHGAQKLFSWFGGYGLAGTGGFMENLGFRPGRLFAFSAGATEMLGGLLTILGLGGALGPALIVLVMVVAIFSVHIKNGWFTANNGVELNIFYILSAIAVAFAGFGPVSLDRVLGLNVLSTPSQAGIAILAGAVLGLLNLVARRPVEAAAQ